MILKVIDFDTPEDVIGLSHEIFSNVTELSPEFIYVVHF